MIWADLRPSHHLHHGGWDFLLRPCIRCLVESGL